MICRRLYKILNAQKFLYATNVLGLPSVALPTHLAGTVPVGVQLVAPMHEDFFALNVAEKLENQLGRLITKIP